MASLEKQVSVKYDQHQEIKKRAELLLDPLMAKLNPVMKDLRTLRHSDLDCTSCKSGGPSQRCPPRLYPTMQALMMMLGVEPAPVRKSGPDYWQAAKTQFADHRFLSRLTDFDKDGQKKDTVEAVEKFIEDSNAQDPTAFDVAAVRLVSRAGGVFCAWILVMLEYREVSRQMDPVRRELARAEEELGALMEELAGLQNKSGALGDTGSQGSP